MCKPIQNFNVFEPNWWKLPGSKTSKDWENAQENGNFGADFIY